VRAAIDLLVPVGAPGGLELAHQSRVFGMPRLEDYSFGRIVVDGEEQTRDLIVLPHRVLTNWWRREGHSLAVEDLVRSRTSCPRSSYSAPGRTAGLPRAGP
jgi:hypothetical protein